MAKVQQAFEQALTDAGYTPYCVITDDSISEGVDDEINAQIRQSRFLIADLTDEGDQGRRNIYYEAGFGYGLWLQVIYTCQEKQFEGKRCCLRHSTTRHPAVGCVPGRRSGRIPASSAERY